VQSIAPWTLGPAKGSLGISSEFTVSEKEKRLFAA
jgi:hypothetical protein